jgi:hypothetical protein
MHLVLIRDPQGDEQAVGPFATIKLAQQWFVANLSYANRASSQIMSLDNPADVPADSVHADFLAIDSEDDGDDSDPSDLYTRLQGEAR